MTDLRLDLETHDIVFVDGDLAFVEDDEAIAQNLKIRFLFFAEEWFLDTRLGIPYFRDILIKNPDEDLIRYLFIRAAETTAGVDSVTEFSLAIDKNARKLSINLRALLDSGEELVFTDFILDV